MRECVNECTTCGMSKLFEHKYMRLLRVLYSRNLLEVLVQKPESTSLEEGRASKVKLLKFLRVLVKVKSRGKNTPFARWEDT